MLVLSGLGAVVVPSLAGTELSQELRTVHFSQPQLQEQDNYLTISLPEATSTLLDTGKPVLPMVAQVFTFPSGTLIKNVDVTFTDVIEQTISQPIIPAREPVPLIEDIQFTPQIIEDMSVYGGAQLYPEQPWAEHIGYGLKDTMIMVYLAVYLCPIRYSPATNTLFVAQGADITVSYVPPSTPPARFTEDYDLLIITPEKFVDKLQTLVDHKESHNVKTLVKTTEDIYTQYTTGRDDQEKIKLCIYDMKETYNITYVLLFGGRNGQKLKWFIPERVTNNNDGWELGYASDLYYADIYKYNESSGLYEFEDWDSNGNGKFAEWGTHLDTIDYYPDVYIGRLAVRFNSDADTVINKIITYETGTDAAWFKKMICVAGDTFVPSINGDHSGVPEGEVECDHAAGLMEPLGFDVTKLYTSDESFTGPDDVIAEVHDGAGFLMFSGHGNPSTWGTHAPESGNFTTGLSFTHFGKLKNKEKLPVVTVGGCHNSQFNVTVFNLLIGILTYGFKEYFQYKEEPIGHFWRKEWVPWCWSEWLVRQKNGGAIAAIGCTGLGYGDFGYDTLKHYGGWIDGRFYDAYANQSKTILGQTHTQAIIDYINLIGGVNTQQLDRKTIEEWCLLGDPSLLLGGYE